MPFSRGSSQPRDWTQVSDMQADFLPSEPPGKPIYRHTYILLHACSVTQLYPTLCDPMDCSLPGSSVHGIFHARILKWVAISSSKESSQPRDWTCISCISCIAGEFFTPEPLGKPTYMLYIVLFIHVCAYMCISMCICCSVTKSYLNLCDPVDCSPPGIPVLHHTQSLIKLMSIESVMPSNHLILCCPHLLLPTTYKFYMETKMSLEKRKAESRKTGSLSGSIYRREANSESVEEWMDG